MKDNARDERLVFTAMEGIFPGASDIDAYWGRIVRAEPAPLVSLERRWKMPRESYFDPVPGKPDKICMDRAFCLGDDELLHGRQTRFGVAVARRLFEALRAGKQPPDPSRTGLVAGTAWSDEGFFENDRDYLLNIRHGTFAKARHSPDEQLNAIAGSVGITGPQIAVDTACASSLYAVVAARNLIESGECDAVLVMGLYAMVVPLLMSAFSQIMALSPSGQILPFAANASGIVLGEAACAVLLERPEAALSAGRRPLGSLVSAGLSSDGSEGSAFAPGREGQLRAYHRAYEGAPAGEIDYLEAHGTGTALGDATEVEVLMDFFAPRLPAGRKIPIGSVKAIIGHTLNAAGMASLIKCLLMLRERTIPPHVRVDPLPRLAESPFELPGAPRPLDPRGRPARMGISAFGFGGSNSHMVIESFDETKPRRRAARRDARVPLDIAIIDFEAAFGKAIGTDAWIRARRDNDFAVTPFPKRRFSRAFSDSVRGIFFPDEITIDAAGLRMGPKLIPRADPFQNLASSLAKRLVDRNPDLKNAEDAAVAMCGNVGGGTFFALSRKFRLAASGSVTGMSAIAGPDSAMNLEEIVSCLGSMTSGYPALHFNLRGFHQTFSGDLNAFMTSLAMAPGYLRRHARRIIVGAGHFIKTPLDLFHPAIRFGTRESVITEGMGMFLLAAPGAAEGRPPLAVIRDIISGSEAASFDVACAMAGVDPGGIDLRHTVQLDPSAAVAASPDWFMGEATGIDALVSILTERGKRAAIECLYGDRLLYAVFIDRMGDAATSTPPPVLPVTVSFDARFVPSRGVPEDAGGATTPPTPTGGVFAVEAEEFARWHAATGRTIGAYFRLQSKILSLLELEAAGGPAGPDAAGVDPAVMEERIRRLRADGRNVVIRDAAFPSGGTCRAALVVDESHPYFFDHPLDHVPGILLLEGALQLFEAAAPELIGAGGDSYAYVRKAAITFKKWCEKGAPATLELGPHGGPATKGALACQVRQHDRVIGTIILEGGAWRRTASGAAPAGGDRPPYHDMRCLHKHRGENVLVTDIAEVDGGAAHRARTADVPPGHFFADGDTDFLSILYALECSRQAAMLMSHTAAGVPLGRPMTLLSVEIGLDRPPRRREPLSLTVTREGPVAIGGSAVWNVTVALADGHGPLGTCALSTMVDDDASYRGQRWKEGT